MRIAFRVIAFGLAAGALSGTAQAQTLSSKFYQENVFRQCSSGIACTATYPAIPADRILKVNSVSCRVFVTSRTAIFSQVEFGSDKGDGPFFLDVMTISYPEDGRLFAASFKGPVYLSHGATPRVSAFWAGGSVSFNCNVAGLTEKSAPPSGAGAAEGD
ncbi:hypothetical protein ACFOWB_03610 [Chenggangzhangella methanolivorans]